MQSKHRTLDYLIFLFHLHIHQKKVPTPEAASCDQRILSTSSGVVTLPNYPEFFQGYAICDFVIETSPGSTVRLTVQDIDVSEIQHFYILGNIHPIKLIFSSFRLTTNPT